MNWKLLAKAFVFVVLGLAAGVGGMFFLGWAITASKGWFGLALFISVMTGCVYEALK